MRSSFVPKSQPKITEISDLEVYYFKVSTKVQKEDRLSFCINLDVVNFQGRNPKFIVWEKLWLDKLVLRLTDL